MNRRIKTMTFTGMGYDILMCIGMLLFASCGGQAPAKSAAQRDTCVFTLPVPPSVLTGVEERAEYVAGHYWQGLDYADSAWLADSAALEQIFVDWIPVLELLPPESRAEAVGTVITCGKEHAAMQLRLGELAELYFHDPNSPYRNEELYIPILNALIETPHIQDIYKERYRYQLEKALMNRPGTRAADFSFLTSEHRSGRLSAVKGDFTLLYFFNPDCPDCRHVAAYISRSHIFSSLSAAGRMTVLAVYPDEDLQAWEKHLHALPEDWIVARYAASSDREAYDLPAIPCLYLLDRDKTVLLKDAPVEKIEAWLEKTAKE